MPDESHQIVELVFAPNVLPEMVLLSIAIAVLLIVIAVSPGK